MTNATLSPKKATPRPPMVEPSRRYVVNVKLLAITAALIVVALPSAYLWYKFQLNKNSVALLSRAEQLEEEGDWSAATMYY